MLDRSFIKSITTALSGGILVQLVGLMASPIIARIYSPDIYGTFSTITAYASLLVPLLTLSYSIVLVLPKLKINAFSILISTIAYSVVVGFLMYLLSYLLKADWDIISEWDWAIIILAWNLSILQLYSYWFIREEAFLFRAKYLLAQSFLVAGLKILFGMYLSKVEFLFLATAIPNALVIFFISHKVFHENKIYIYKYRVKSITCRAFYNVKKYFNIVKFRTPQSVLVSFNTTLPLLAIPMVFNAHYVGLFALTRTVLMLPGSLISTSVGDVIYPRLNNAINNKVSILNDLFKLILCLFVLGLIPLSILYLFGEELFLLVFGSQWGKAGELSSILSFWVFVNLINRPLVVLIPIFKLEKKFLVNSFFNAVLGIACFFVSKQFDFSFIDSMKLYTFILVLPQVFIMITVIMSVMRYEKELN